MAAFLRGASGRVCSRRSFIQGSFACNAASGSVPCALRRRALAAACDAFAALVCAAILVFAYTAPAFAYVDPSVMTYAIQAVAGVAVALSTVAGVAFRRTRKKIFKALGIDEEARKEHEPRYHRLGEDGQPVMTAADRRFEGAASASPAAGAGTPAQSAKGRIILALAASVFASFTLCVVAPYELVSGSAGSLVVRLQDIWPIMAVLGLAVAAVLTVALSLLRGKAQSIAVAAVFAFALCCYVQAMFLNGGLPQADGSAVDWSAYAGASALSAVVWLALLVGCIVAALKAPRQTRAAVGAVSVVLVLVQAVGVATLFADGSQAGGQSIMVSQKGLLDVSADKNIIEFVLDDYDTQTLKEALQEEPALLSDFDGFTWFENSAGSMIPTRYGNVFLLTGEYPRKDEPFSSFLKNRYARSSYLQDINDAGYSIGIYSDTLGEQYLSAKEANDLIYSHTENIGALNSGAIDGLQTAGALMQCALYRDAPWILKPLFWFYTDDINNRIFGNGQNDPAQTPYLMNDAALHTALQTQGLAFNDEQASYRYIHILGAHDPFSLDRNGENVGVGNSTRTDQAIGSLRIVSSYIAQLKKLGVYDGATIIVTSDHGTWWSQTSDLSAPKSPILLAKPAHAGAAGGAGATVSDAPVSADQILATIVSVARGNDAAAEYELKGGRGKSDSDIANDGRGGNRGAGSGEGGAGKTDNSDNDSGFDKRGYGGNGKRIRTLFEAAADPSNDEPRYFYMTTSNGVHDVSIDEYEITGDVSDISNWRKTGASWPADE